MSVPTATAAPTAARPTIPLVATPTVAAPPSGGKGSKAALRRRWRGNRAGEWPPGPPGAGPVMGWAYHEPWAATSEPMRSEAHLALGHMCFAPLRLGPPCFGQHRWLWRG